jgi:NTP pyrophosphatase (non-canonical NTP hydrolase)
MIEGLPDNIPAAVQQRIAAADSRYGTFASTHEGLGVACEEWDELRDAVRRNHLLDVQAECLDLAAVFLRLARDVFNTETASRSIK